jgi:hypothetical protein
MEKALDFSQIVRCLVQDLLLHLSPLPGALGPRQGSEPEPHQTPKGRLLVRQAPMRGIELGSGRWLPTGSGRGFDSRRLHHFINKNRYLRFHFFA